LEFLQNITKIGILAKYYQNRNSCKILPKLEFLQNIIKIEILAKYYQNYSEEIPTCEKELVDEYKALFIWGWTATIRSLFSFGRS
jgi:hypothetical protein